MVIGTIEALGVFLLAVLPGFVGIRLYGLGRPPLRVRGVLQEIATTLSWSLAGWVVLYLWRGQELLPTVLAAKDDPVTNRIDAFAELVALAVAIGVALAIVARIAAAGLHLYVTRGDPSSLVAQSEQHGLWRALGDRVGQRLRHELRNSSVPGAAWDRLLARLNNRRETVLCRVKTSDGQEVLGVLADEAYADWGADGRDLLLMPEVVRDANGNLCALQASRGVFVAGGQISSLSVVRLPDGALPLPDDG
jgi:hypothetical protein